MRYVLEIYRGEEFLISGELVYVYADTTVRKGVALPEAWRSRLVELERLAPVQQ
jgi:acyl-CoA thioester hydrolase